MGWGRVDDDLHSHLKAIKAGLEAMGLWSMCLSWTSKHLTDGLIPQEVAESVRGFKQELADRLVDVRLWERAEGGYQMHDFHDCNPTAAEQVEKRDAWREKKQRQRGQKRASRVDSPGESRVVSPGDTRADRGGTPQGNPPGSPGSGMGSSSPGSSPLPDQLPDLPPVVGTTRARSPAPSIERLPPYQALAALYVSAAGSLGLGDVVPVFPALDGLPGALPQNLEATWTAALTSYQAEFKLPGAELLDRLERAGRYVKAGGMSWMRPSGVVSLAGILAPRQEWFRRMMGDSADWKGGPVQTGAPRKGERRSLTSPESEDEWRELLGGAGDERR